MKIGLQVLMRIGSIATISTGRRMRTLVGGACLLLANAAAVSAQRVGEGTLKRLIADKAADARETFGALPGTQQTSCVTDYNTLKPGTAYSVSGSTSTIPVTFSRVEKDAAGKYSVGAALNLGYGYTWFGGSGSYLATPAPSTPVAGGGSNDGTMDVDPEIFGGLALNTGIRNESAGVGGALSATGFVGFKMVAVSAGYDFIAKSPIFGLSAKIDPFKFRRGSGARLCIKPGF